MQGLLTGTLFSGWELRSFEAGLISHISIDGKINPGYLTEEEKKTRAEDKYLLWEEIQPKIRMLIQGGHTPSAMSITLAIQPSRLKEVPSDAIESYQLNLRFETIDETGASRQRLMLITGVSTKTFTIDKNPERAWDSKVPEYFRIKGFPLTEA